MKPNSRKVSSLVALIENFFPDVTLIDLGAFYAMGLISGLATGISWGVSRRAEGDR